MNVLFLTPIYDHFMKEIIDSISNYCENVTVLIRYNPIFDMLIHLPKIGAMFKTASRKVINYENIPQNVSLFPIKCWLYNPFIGKKLILRRLLKKFQKILRKNQIKFDIIHSHFTWINGFIGIVLKDKYNLPVILTLHENNDWFNNIIESRKNAYFDVWTKCDFLTRVNKKDSEFLKKFNKNTIYIPNGYDSRKIKIIPKEEAKRNLNLCNQNYIIFNYSNLIRRKGHEILIHSVSELLNDGFDVSCFIGGDGPERSNLENLIISKGLSDKINLVGYIDNTDLVNWLNSSDIFAFPSYSESFGIVQIEALAAGLPVISFANGGSEEIIINENLGYIAPEKTVHDFCLTLKRAISQDWDRNYISTYSKKFELRKIAKQYINLYSKAINETN